MDEVRDMSLRQATAGLTAPGSTLGHGQRSTSSRGQSADSRRHGARDRSRNIPGDERRTRRRSESRQRQVEHQSSLRSLLGSSEMSERDIQREIEEFARQIQEEGLLDGLDLDNIDLTRDDELSRRVTEAYRRRQRERARGEPSRRNNNNHNGQNGASRSVEAGRSDSRLRAPDNGHRSRNSSRSTTGSAHSDDRSRPPPANSSLEAPALTSRPRRRTASGGRSSTTPITPSAVEARPAARSQTDLPIRTRASDAAAAAREGFGQRRTSSNPQMLSSPSVQPEETNTAAAGNNASFASRATQLNVDATPSTPVTEEHHAPGHSPRHHAPVELAIVHSAAASPLGIPSGKPGHQRTRSQLYPEPSIACSRCHKPHIEYDLHYNCATCSGGQWNICIDCYRAGKGCQYWFGFGYGAWKKWERKRQQEGDSLEKPHMFTACRYLPPPSTPGGADGRKTLTTDDPQSRLQTGTFCARCFTWTNDCYWRCDVCNEGDWGFCNNCVNQGKSCTHLLLPLTHEASQASERPQSPRSPGRPPASFIYTGPQASNVGPFKPLSFKTQCDVCHDPISPSHVRYHCFSCSSALLPESRPGDYEICSSCYNSLVSRGQISAENGHSGWRRCLNGHRMAVIGFTGGKIGLWRFVERDIVGGHVLRSESHGNSPDQNGEPFQKWSWEQGGDQRERLVTNDVSATAPPTDGGIIFSQSFPPDGGVGKHATARWAWYPKPGSNDELLFPKGAEIREIADVNGEWFFGTYMGAKGLFPAPYVQRGPRQSGDGR